MASDLKYYMTNANDAVNIIFVETVEDMANPTMHKPNMTHQIFDKEYIFGYSSLKVNLFYSAHSYHCYVEIEYEQRWEDGKLGMVVDDVIEQLRPWLREAIVLEKEAFVSILANEKQMETYGDLIQEFYQELDQKNCNFTITNCDLADPAFGRLHKRFESLIIMYIDAANFIDLADPNWRVVYLYKKNTFENGHFHYLPIGFCTIYIFNYKKTARISQFFVIPKYQRMGLGKILLTNVYEFLKKDISGIRKVTVESPNEIFTEMRDKIDAIRLSDLPNFKEDAIKKGFTSDMAAVARVNFKVNKKQAHKIYEILRCHYAKPGTPDFDKFKSDFIKVRRLEVFGVKDVSPEQQAQFLKVAAEGEPPEESNVDESFCNFLKSIDKVLKYLDTKEATKNE